MMILALERDIPGTAGEQFAPFLQAEAHRVWELRQEDVLRNIWFCARDHSAVIMLECDSELEAQEVLSSLPLVKAGLIFFETLPLVPYDGFSRLFQDRPTIETNH